MDFLQRVAKFELGEGTWHAFERAVSVPTWQWKRLPTYNGFTHEDRVRAWQLTGWMMKTGRMPRPERCSVSGSTLELQYHAEDYYRPWTAYPISKPIHLALHRRFSRPDRWLAIRDEYGSDINAWFLQLRLAPYDLAANLRATMGDGDCDRGPTHRGVRNRAPIL
jgi:hypothetical protein